MEINLPKYAGTFVNPRSRLDLDTGGLREGHGEKERADGMELQVDISGVHWVKLDAIYHSEEVPKGRFNRRLVESVPVHADYGLPKVGSRWIYTNGRLKSTYAPGALVIH
jgi:hypothetical protein